MIYTYKAIHPSKKKPYRARINCSNNSVFTTNHTTSTCRLNSKKGRQKVPKTYNTRDSLVVTDPTTSLALTGLSVGERTGSRVLQWVWSYVLEVTGRGHHVGKRGGGRVSELPRRN